MYILSLSLSTLLFLLLLLSLSLSQAWRPNTFTVSRKELVRITQMFQVKTVTFHFHFFIFTFHFHFYSHFQAMLAIQTGCNSVEECHKNYGVNQSFLDMVKISSSLSLVFACFPFFTFFTFTFRFVKSGRRASRVGIRL